MALVNPVILPWYDDALTLGIIAILLAIEVAIEAMLLARVGRRGINVTASLVVLNVTTWCLFALAVEEVNTLRGIEFWAVVLSFEVVVFAVETVLLRSISTLWSRPGEKRLGRITWRRAAKISAIGNAASLVFSVTIPGLLIALSTTSTTTPMTMNGMPSPMFWSLIEDARRSTRPSGHSTTPEALERVLEKCSNAELQAFAADFERALIALNTWELWGAGHVIAGGMGDDHFHYFRTWIVGKGRGAFETALRAPDDLGAFVLESEDAENEALEYVATEILEARGGDDAWLDEVEGHPDQEPTGVEWDEATVANSYPKLAARFWDE